MDGFPREIIARQAEQIKQLEAERDAMKYEWQAACSLVAEMHKAGVGDYQGCTNGVVEDIADLKAERDRLRAALEVWRESR